MALHYKQELAAPISSRKTLRKMLALIPALALAVLCYSITAYAWFSASIGNTGNVITAATYGLEVSVTAESGSTIEPQNGVFSLAEGESYKVKLIKTGDASKGYCVVKEGKNTYYTAPITEEFSSFTFNIYEAGKYTFTAAWGDYTGSEIIRNGGSIGTPANPANEPNALPAADDTAATSSEPTETAVPESASITQPTEHQTQLSADPTTESSSEPSVTEPNAESEPTITIPETSSSAPSGTVSSTTASAEESPERAPAENAGTDSSIR